ncbi:MAG: integral membrane protein [Parcubacteria group bacterium Greene1014_20]|nr:MAG: integral membrane protein [Parcubacteria group bacterium Greene1014_20]
MELNYSAIVVASLVYFVLGAFWYSPVLFAKPWMKMLGFSGGPMTEDQKKGMMRGMFFGFISYIVMVGILDYYLYMLGVSNAASGAFHGLLMGLGFIATTGLASVLWEKRPLALYLINVTYPILGLAIAGAILGAW